MEEQTEELPVPVLTSAFEDRTLPERPAPVRERPVGEEDAEGGENRNRRRHRGGRRRNGGEASNAGEATRREPPKSAAGQSAERGPRPQRPRQERPNKTQPRENAAPVSEPRAPQEGGESKNRRRHRG